MKNKLGKRYLFLPINEVIIKEYNGYIYKGQLMPELKEADVKETIKETHIDFHPKGIQKVIMGFFLIVLTITTLPFLLIWVLINEPSGNSAIDKIEFISAKLAFVKAEISINQRTVYKKEFTNRLYWEKVSESLYKISESNYYLVFYAFDNISADVIKTIQLINEKYNLNCQILVDKISIKNFIYSYVNIKNSKILIEDINDVRFWNELNFNDISTTTSRDQNIILWDRYSTNNFFQSTKIKEYSTLEKIVHREISKGYLVRSDVYTNPSDVFFIGHSEDEHARKFIIENYENLNKRFTEKGYKLNLLLIDVECNSADSLFQKITKFIPWAINNADLIIQIEQLMKNPIIKEQDFESDFLAFLGLPELSNACLIRYIDLYHSEYFRNFLAYNLNGTTEEIQSKIDFYLENIDNHFHGYPAYSMYKGPYDADLFFNYKYEQSTPSDDELEEAGEDKELLLQIHNTIESAKQQNKVGLIIGLFREIAINIKDTNPELAKDLINVLNKHTAQPKLSRLLITKDYKIILSDYNNLEIPMYPLAKIVFLLFINHPEGILFKNMIDYREEIEDLYMMVTGRVISPKIKNSLNDITDASCNSIAQKVARIRSSFKAYLPEQIADYYSIKGENAEPKFIAINRELVIWERKK